jgi:predicted N-acetyltransferase YhbS
MTVRIRGEGPTHCLCRTYWPEDVVEQCKKELPILEEVKGKEITTDPDGSLNCYGLGPISVQPELHKQGIGKALMHEGLAALKLLGAKGCVLVGDRGYYERFSFKSFPDLVIDGVPQENVLALPFGEGKTSDRVVFHDGFAATA